MSIKHDRKRARTRTEVALIFVGVVALFITFAGGVVAAQDDVGGVSIGEELKDGFESDRSVDVILRMGKVDVRTPPGLRRAEARANAVEQMKRGAEKRQEPVIDRLEDMEGVDVRSSFWMGNAVRVDVDTSRVSLDELKSLPGVIRIHENHRVEALSVAPSSDIDAGQLEPMSHTTESYSWALEQINVPDIQREFGSLLAEDDTQVAVLDTGIDPNHPDLTVNGWAEFDDNGTKVNSNPNDCDVHGTHVSGTVAGNGSIDEDDYGLYGVAPDTVELYHGGVLTEESTGGCGTGSFASILAGMEWAANETDSDIISMSLGASGTHADYIQPVQQAQNAGSAVVASIGNDGVGTSGSPGNVYDSISVGASTKGGYIANFSGGEVIDTDSAWNNPPEDWPDSYTVPSVSAPGRGIYSSVNDGDYEGLQGTSMAAPHVSGAAALIMSVDPNDDMTPNELEGLLRNTSRKPDVTGLDAEFSVGIDDINSPLNEGDVLQVDYSLTVSNEAETGLVVLQILDENGNIVQEIADTTYRTIEPGDTATGTLSWNTTGQTDGTYIAGVGVINATGEIDDTATNTFDIGSGSTTSIAAADGDTTDLTFSIAQTDTDTRYGTGIIDPYAAIVEEFVDGNVSGTNIQEGTYETGDVVNATVTLNNTGDIQNEFFVHHEVQGPDGVWRDNAGNTGKSVQLSPDSSPEQVDVSWEVEDNAPEGTYNSSITVWAEQDYEHREHDIQQLDETDTFEVDNTTSDTNLRVKDVEAQEPVVEGEELNVVVDVENQGVNVTDNQNVLLNVRVNETLNLEDVDSESVSVNPDDNETVTLTYTTKEGDSGENSRISVEAVTEDDTEGENDTAGIIALDFWNEVTESDGDLSLFDAGTAIQEFHDDGQVNGITFTLRDVNLLALYYEKVNGRSVGEALHARDKAPENYRNMDKVFPSNSIKSGGDGNVWELDKAEQSVHLPETYTYNGEKSVEDYINRTGTTGIVVAHDGTILNETYYRGYNASSKATSWSVAKSFTSALTMRAVENESIDLSLEDNVTEYLPELEGSGYEDAKVKHVLTMSSGADGTHFGRTDADYRNVSIPSRAYFNNESLLEQFSGYDSQFEPGTDQNYINSDTAVLGLVLEEVTGQPLNRYLEDEIWKPVGMEADTFWSTDNEGNNIGMCCLNAQLRDYTRFGRLYLNDGRRTDTGEQIIPANLVNESTQPQGSGIGGVGYGYSWWVPSEDEFAAIGLNGQYIYVNESKDVVVTKTSTDVGLTTDREHIEFFRAVSTLEGEEPKNASFAVNITDTNSPVEGETLSVDVRVENTGDENDTQTVTLDVGTLGNSSTNVTLPGGSSATGTLTLGTSAGDAGEYTATVFSDDDSDARSVTVNDAQTAPTIDTNTGSSVDEGASDTITQSELETTDAEQGPSSLTYTIDADVSEGLLFNTNTSTQLEQGDSFTQQDINDDFIEYRHDGTEPTSESFDFTVRDGAGGSVSGNFSITINQVNDAPTANDDDITPSPAPTEDDDLTASTAYGGIDVIGNDDSRSGVNIDSDVDDPISALSIESITTGQGTETAENTPLTLVDTTQGFNNQEIRFHVSFSGQEVTVAEQSNLDALPGGTTGTFSFDYTVQDDDGDTGNGSTATVTFKVTGVNDAPTANDDFASTDQDTSVTVDVVANDADVDDGQSQLDVTAITNGPSHGTAQITGTSNDKIEFTPGSGATSDVQITYEVSDDNGDTDTATLSMTVNETGIFGVNVTGTNSPVTEGDALEVMANVTNTGGESGTRTITLDVPGLGTDSTTVSLPGGASTTETLTLGTDSGDAGTYTATVESENDTDTTEVVVDEPANFAVSLTATNSPVTEGETLTVDADIRNTGDAQGTQTVGLNAETLGNDSTSVTLTGGANTTVTLSVGTGAGDAGSYTATVSSDNDTASTTVEVQEPQQPPNFAVSIDATNSPVTEGDTLEVTANVTNTGDEPDTQEVSLTDFDGVEQDSISVTLGSGEFNTITLNWSTSEGDNGTGDVTVSTENDTDTANVTVEPVAEPNTPPVANFTLTPGIPSTADTVEFDASSSDDPDGSVSDYGWDFGDGNGDTGRNVTHSYSDNGTFTVTLTVTDDDGATNSTNETVTVSNVPPSADFVFSPNTPTPSDTVSFDSSPSLGSSTDPDGSIVEYEWDFGDGSTEKGETAEHSYDNPGSFTVTLSVTDDDGSTVNTTQGVTVEEETFEEEEGCVNRREVGRGNEDRACPSDEGTQRRDRGRGQEDGETNERRGSSRGSGSRDTDRRRDRGR